MVSHTGAVQGNTQAGAQADAAGDAPLTPWQELAIGILGKSHPGAKAVRGFAPNSVIVTTPYGETTETSWKWALGLVQLLRKKGSNGQLLTAIVTKKGRGLQYSGVIGEVDTSEKD